MARVVKRSGCAAWMLLAMCSVAAAIPLQREDPRQRSGNAGARSPVEVVSLHEAMCPDCVAQVSLNSAALA